MDTCDILIRGGDVIDGSGAARQRADIAISGDRIAAVGVLDGWSADELIDAGGKVVAPGFIDAHTHDDRAVLAGPDMTPKISQGVTTVIAGNCGVSLAPLDIKGEPPPPMNLLGDRSCFRFKTMRDYVETIEDEPAAVNIAMLVGHSTLRAGVMDRLDRAATAAEVEAMGALLDEALQAGAIGLSTGLAYPTAIDAPTEEVIGLARHLAPHSALYTTHMRNESDGVLDSIDETVRIGQAAGVAVVISHHKCSGEANWGRSRDSLARIAAAQSHMKLDFDVYPYAASSTVLSAEWIEGKHDVQITWSKAEPQQAGRKLADIAADWGCSQEQAIERLQPAGAIYFAMDEDDLQRILAFPGAMVGSDGLPHDERPHPRLWGTFPRVLGHYARDLALFSLEEAVHRMTGVTAAVFGLAGRGLIETGAFADVVVFDPEEVIDRANYDSPEVPADGIALVIVNGQPVWRDKSWSGARPGRLLRRTSAQA